MKVIENTFLILCECGIDIIHRNSLSQGGCHGKEEKRKETV